MTQMNGRMGVIFDLDGVLVDSGWAHRQAWCDMAEREGFRMSDEFFTNTFGMQNYQILPMLAGRDLSCEEIDRLADWKEQRYRELITAWPFRDSEKYATKENFFCCFITNCNY